MNQKSFCLGPFQFLLAGRQSVEVFADNDVNVSQNHTPAGTGRSSNHTDLDLRPPDESWKTCALGHARLRPGHEENPGQVSAWLI